jgi:hypothetical protein
LIDFIPIWIGFDSWLTPTTCPVYLALTTLVMYWAAAGWERHKNNRYLTLGLRPRYSRVGVFAGSVAVVVMLNLLAMTHACQLMPGKLALVPPRDLSHHQGL